MAVYPVVCANEKEAIVKFGTWMHKHYQNSLHLALEMAERDDDGASRPAPCPKLRAPYPELQNFGYRALRAR